MVKRVLSEAQRIRYQVNDSRMRAAPRADDADVASLVGRFRAKGEEESRRRDAFDKEWDQRVSSFRKRCDAVERKLRDRHAAALEKTRASLEARLVSKPKRYTPQLEELLRKRKELMRRRQFSEALDALKQAEAREKLELEDHKRRVRGENVELLDALFRTQRDELAVFARERDAEETRINAARADAAARAAKRGFRDYEPRAGEPRGDGRLPGSDDGDEGRATSDAADGDAAPAAAEETAHLVSKNVARVPSMRRRRAVTANAGDASRSGETRADRRARVSGDGETELRDGDGSATPPPLAIKNHAERTERTEQRIASANASSAAVLDFYSDVGGVADVMRLDVNPTTRAPEPVAFRDSSPPGSVLNASHPNGAPSRASASRSEAVTLDSEVDRGHRGHDGHATSLATRDDRSQSANVRDETSTLTSKQREVNAYGAFLRVAPYAGAYAFGPNADDAAYGFMVSDAQTRELAELHARRDAALRAWELEERLLVRSSAGTPTTRTTPTVAPTAAAGLFVHTTTAPRVYPTLRNRPVTGSTASPRRGLSGAEARAAADGLVAAAMRMTRADAKRAPPESTAKRRAREEAAAAAQARAARRRELKGDDGGGVPLAGGGYLSDDDSSVDSEELDDLYLAQPPETKRKGSAGGGAAGAAAAEIGVRLALGALAGAFKDEPGPHAPRGGGVTVGSLGTSAAPRVLPGVMTHRARDDATVGIPPSARGMPTESRGRAAPRAADGAADPRRDFPAGDVARGAALLRRMPGPDDCYRSRRLGAGDAAAGIGELGFPGRDDGILAEGSLAVPERGDVPVAEANAATIVDSLGGGGGGGGGGEAPRERGLAALRSRSDENRVAADARLDDSRVVADAGLSPAAERKRKQSAAVAAARAAAFKYGATTAPAVGAFGQPIQTRPVRETAPGDAAAAIRKDLGDPKAFSRRRAAPLGHDVDPVTLLKLSDVSLTRAVERDGFSRGEVLVAKLDANERGGADHQDHQSGLATKPVSFADPTAAPAPATSAEIELLFKHCRKGEYELCRDLFKRRGIDPNVRDAHGNTPLIAACQNGAGRVAKLCLRRGADVNGVNAKKNGALHFAARFGFDALARWLVDNGADTRAVNENGKKPFEGSL